MQRNVRKQSSVPNLYVRSSLALSLYRCGSLWLGLSDVRAGVYWCNAALSGKTYGLGGRTSLGTLGVICTEVAVLTLIVFCTVFS